MSLAKIVSNIMINYIDRPAIGEREKDFVINNKTKETSIRLLPTYITKTYGEVWAQSGALAAELYHHRESPLSAGQLVAFLSFTSANYAILDLACIRLGAVTVPLQTGSSLSQLDAILKETSPKILSVSVEYLDIGIELAINHKCIERIVILDYHEEVSEHNIKLTKSREILKKNNALTTIDSLDNLIKAGGTLTEPSLYESESVETELAMLIYTSGSTGTPKGAIYTQKLAAGMWGGSWATIFSEERARTFHYMPMSHVAGHSSLKSTWARGGTCFFTASSNFSTLLEDISLTKPTELSLIPRICEMIHQKYQAELAKVGFSLEDKGSQEVLYNIRTNTLGGQVNWASCSSAPISHELKIFIESLLEIPLHNVYGSTEAGVISIDNELLAPPVDNYKIIDAPELGYFKTDAPHPRGELLLRTQSIIPGYYKRPELEREIFDEDGYYKTGDIVSEIKQNKLINIDRRKNIIKLSQGEFVATAQLETVFSSIADIRCIFIFGKSEWSHLLAVIVPSLGLINRCNNNLSLIKKEITDKLIKTAKDNDLRKYEIPREILIELEEFTQYNGLLSDHGKPLWPKLREKYSHKLEALHDQLMTNESRELREIQERISDQSVLDTLKQLVRSLVGNASNEINPNIGFRDLGGDSLTAVTIASILSDMYGISVPVDMLISPAYDLRHISEYVEITLLSGTKRPTASLIHGAKCVEFRAQDLMLDRFIDEKIISKSGILKFRKARKNQTILLTGATGYLGRFLCLQLLEELRESGGRLICIVRGEDLASATKRLHESFGNSGSPMYQKFRHLSEIHLEVLPGDISKSRLGLEINDWERLCHETDRIIHAGALVNHILSYKDLFDANVMGTAEIISLALSVHLKPIVFLSSVAVSSLLQDQLVLDENSDIRAIAPVIFSEDTYASGYGLSKWASEVLLRQAHEKFGLPVTTFRSSMILAHRHYQGQINVPDMFTRLLLSVALTGIAPPSFYGPRQSDVHKPHYDGLPVDFTAAAIVKLGVSKEDVGYRSFNLVNPHNDGISLDTFVKWMQDYEVRITQLDNYTEWNNRFETLLRSLPENIRKHSFLPLIHGLNQPHPVTPGSTIPSPRFQEAVAASQLEPIPHISEKLIQKYVDDLKFHNLLGSVPNLQI